MMRKLSNSQNFLINPEFIERLLKKTNITKNDLVLDIGAGKGIITEELSKKSDNVIAIEFDKDLYKQLINKFKIYNNVEVIHQNILDYKLPEDKYKVFANIPFDMTSNIVNKLLFSTNPPVSCYLIMQDKAAMRFIGTPISTQISILLQPFYEIFILDKIPNNEFYPIPNVKTVMVAFNLRNRPLIGFEDREVFTDFVVYGFNQWQPTVSDAYANLFTKVQLKRISSDLKIQSKPSAFSIDEWIKLFNIFSVIVSLDKKSIIYGAEKRLRKSQEKMTKMYRTR